MQRCRKGGLSGPRGILLAIAVVMLAGVCMRQTAASLAPAQRGDKSAKGTAASKAAEEKLKPHEVSVMKSRVYILVDKTGLGHRHGVEGRLKSGSLKLGMGSDAGELVFDMTSFDADTDAARKYVGLEGSTDASTKQQVNANMKDTSILNVRQYPTATFAVKSATLLDRKSSAGHALYELTGEFSLRGKKQPLKFEAEAVNSEGMSHIRGHFSILQTKYGMKPFRKALGAVGVADELIIYGDLWVATETVKVTP